MIRASLESPQSWPWSVVTFYYGLDLDCSPKGPWIKGLVFIWVLLGNGKILETQPSKKSFSHCWNALKGDDGTLSTSSSSLWSTSHEVNSLTLPHTSSMVLCLTKGPNSTWTIDQELKALKPRIKVSHVSSEWPDYLRCVIKIEADEHSCDKWKIHPWCLLHFLGFPSSLLISVVNHTAYCELAWHSAPILCGYFPTGFECVCVRAHMCVL